MVDLGAAPGGWTQVALQRIGEGGKVVALDLLAMDPVSGAIVLQGDFQDPEAEQAVLAALDGQADLVLSDMAPNTTGHNATDHLRIIALAELALDFAVRVLAPGGAFVAKVFQGGTEKDLLDLLKARFATVRHVKPPASRKDSAELYVVATGFRGRRAKPAAHSPAAPTPLAATAPEGLRGRAKAADHAAPSLARSPPQAGATRSRARVRKVPHGTRFLPGRRQSPGAARTAASAAASSRRPMPSTTCCWCRPIPPSCPTRPTRAPG